jgi:predicted DNA-binding antitoxin AbrB/MazE fold protein
MKTFAMRYEDGVLKPSNPLPLSPGENVEVVLIGPTDPRLKNLQRFAADHGEELDFLTSVGLEEWSAMLGKEDRG